MKSFSKRERMLMWVALGLVPPTIGFALWFIVNSRMTRTRNEIAVVQDGIDAAQRKRLQASEAAARREAYLRASLPADSHRAGLEYRNWLMQLAEESQFEQMQLRTDAQTLRRTTTGQAVFSQFRFTLTGQANLLQLLHFLYEFERQPLMHRVAHLVVRPVVEPNAGGQPAPVSRRLTLQLTIEAISLVEADADRPIPVEGVPELARPLADYEQSIVHRNIFGLPNNAPSLDRLGTRSVTAGRGNSVVLRARDDDADDQLTIELVSSSVPDVAISQNPRSREATIELPPLEVGRYEFSARVTDNGFPPKTETIDFTVNALEPEPVAERDPEPEFQHASQTRITGVTRDRDGRTIVWIHVRTTGQLFRVAIGESFELDGKTWVVHHIEGREVELDCEGRRLAYRVGDMLDSPTSTTDIADAPPSDPQQTIN